ncbi:MAG: hypothetical protein Q7S73_01060 [bacterium]|jgi:3D (Asp-Asp-Asp) domain-containing protein|nr:hypothetical protein [bacterium]
MKKIKFSLYRTAQNFISKTGPYTLALVFALQTASPLLPGNAPHFQETVSQSSLMSETSGPVIMKKLEVTLTGYSSTPDQTDSTPFITASGRRVRDGIIASNVLPFGTKVQIPEIFGDKIFTVEDRMHRRFNDRADIWFPDRSTALKFGIQKATMIAFL